MGSNRIACGAGVGLSRWVLNRVRVTRLRLLSCYFFVPFQSLTALAQDVVLTHLPGECWLPAPRTACWRHSRLRRALVQSGVVACSLMRMREHGVRHIDFPNPSSRFYLRFGADREHVWMEYFHQRAIGLLYSLGARILGNAERLIMRDGPHGLGAQPSAEHHYLVKTNDNQGKPRRTHVLTRDANGAPLIELET